MAEDTILLLSQVFASLYSQVLGNGVIIGLFILFVFALTAFFLGIPAQVAFVVAVPLIFLLIQTGLPQYSMPLMLFVIAILLSAAVMRALRR